MSYRHIFISAVLLAIGFFTIPTCLPYLEPITSWPSTSFSRYGAGAGAGAGVSAAQNQPPSEATRNRRPKVHHPTVIASVPHEYLPTAHNQRRLIIIGDIHGMNTELGHLLDEAHYDPSRDHVVTLGDMVNKGPDSRGVLARLMAMNASAVRGNHEDRMLLALDEYKSHAAQVGHGDDGDGNGNDEPRVIEMRKRDKKILKVAKSLTAEQVKWLSHLPVILKAKSLHLYFVHAGLVPGVRLAKQDPWAVMNMRSLVYPREELRRRADQVFDSDGLQDVLMGQQQHQEEDEQQHQQQQEEEEEEDENNPHHDHPTLQPTSKVIPIPIDNHSGERWAKAWDRHTTRLAKSARWTVLYGHDARRGFSEGKYTVGLDSACVRGGFLTGLVVEAGATKHARFRYTKVQVPCRRYV
ncbi:hypothetical protein E4U55_000613 [Claviceps digitariae]|nr:hypothetical protein E4U55_000613 [Claviceps digitariae]